MTVNRQVAALMRLVLAFGVIGTILAACQHYAYGPNSRRGPAYRDGIIYSSPGRTHHRRTSRNRTTQRRANQRRANQRRANQRRGNRTRNNRGRRTNRTIPVHRKALSEAYRKRGREM